MMLVLVEVVKSLKNVIERNSVFKFFLIDLMQRNPENLKILLKEVDKMHENLDAPTKQRCVDLLKTLLYTREEIIEQVF